MNNKSLEQIWQLACEIQGLTLLADKKEDDPLKDILCLIESKSKDLAAITHDYIDSLNNESEDIEDTIELTLEPLHEAIINAEDEDESDRAHGNLEDDFDTYEDVSEDADEDRSNGNIDDDEETIDGPEIEPIDDDNEDSELSEATDVIEPEVVEFEDTDDDDYVVCDEEDDIELIDDEIEIVDNDVTEFDDNSADIDAINNDIGQYISGNTIDEFINDEPQNTGWTVEHKIAVNESKDLKHAFTINDRYRFKRELFANSEIEMNDTLNLLSAMTTISEAEEYFFEDLEWDKDNDDVKDFMAIIQKHFASKQ